MKRGIVLFVTIIICNHTFIFAQDNHDQEKKVFDYCSAIRTNPKQFLKEVVMPYLEENEMDETNTYVASLIKDLKKQKPLPALVWNEYLHEQSHEFALDMGKTGATGHYSRKLGPIEKRLKKFKNQYPIGENCSYGYDDALDIFMQLLIDDGVPSLGHRKNLLHASFKYVGVAIEPHRIYEWNCVMDFGGAPQKANMKHKKKSWVNSIFASRH